jgi:HD superfamily phosphohydrolase YqeK
MSDREYLRMRAAQEEELASSATNTTAAVIHSAMAAEYRRRLFDLEAERQLSAIQLAAS